MDSLRNMFFYTHYPRFTLIQPIHFSPFKPPMDAEIKKILYADKITEIDPLDEVLAWEDWWKENRDKPFHIQFYGGSQVE